MKLGIIAGIALVAAACQSKLELKTVSIKKAARPGESKYKLNAAECLDPDLSQVPTTVVMMLCDGTIANGELRISYCNEDGQKGCLTNDQFPAADKATAIAGNIRSGVRIAGVGGTYSAGKDCSQNGEIGCMTNTTFKGANLANLSSRNVRDGVSIAGVVGAYPSAAHPLQGADGTADLGFATFNAQIKSAAPFEWFDSAGARFTNVGDTDIDASNIADGISIFGQSGAFGVVCTGDGQVGCVTTNRYKSADTDPAAISSWDIRRGKVFGGVTGDLKFCRNTAQSIAAPIRYDNATSPAAVGLDPFDTLNDNYYLPPDQPFGSDYACDSSNWQDLTPGGCDSLVKDCVFQDKISSLSWSEVSSNLDFSSIPAGSWPCGSSSCTQTDGNVTSGGGSGAYGAGAPMTWYDAVYACDQLIFGGSSDWRLPTQKEMLQAYTDGFASLYGANFIGNFAWVWTATTKDSINNSAWWIHLHEGSGSDYDKTINFLKFLCVRP